MRNLSSANRNLATANPLRGPARRCAHGVGGGARHGGKRVREVVLHEPDKPHNRVDGAISYGSLWGDALRIGAAMRGLGLVPRDVCWCSSTELARSPSRSP